MKSLEVYFNVTVGVSISSPAILKALGLLRPLFIIDDMSTVIIGWCNRV